MPKILFKFPTRGRPKVFRETLDKYYEKLSGHHEFQFLITLDTNDRTMNNPNLRKYLDEKPSLMYCYGDSRTKIEAVNANIECADDGWDILVLLSDDMIPEVQDYDDVIVKSMVEHFPDLNGAIWFNDARAGHLLATMAIMGKPVYDKFGYIYHPDYISLWCDNEYQAVLEKENQIKYIDQVIIKHAWTDLTGSDPLHRRNEAFYRTDQQIYELRKRSGFPKEKIATRIRQKHRI